MALILTTKEQELLVKQSELKDFYTNDYLLDKENENVKIMADLFFSGNRDKVILYNVGTNLFASVADTIAFFVGQPLTDININIEDFLIDYISVGQGAFGLKKTEEKGLETYYIPGEDLIFSDGEWKSYKLYKTIDGNKEYYYLLRQTYKIGEIESLLYKIKNPNENKGELVSLQDIPQTEHLQENIKTGLDTTGLFVLSSRTTISAKVQSELDKIKKQVYSLDRKQVLFETQFLGETDQYKIFENIHIPEEAIVKGKVDISKLGKVLATDTNAGDKGTVKFISNENPLITQAIEYEDKQIRKLSSSTKVPTDFLGLESQGTISGSSRTIMISAFLKKITNIRDKVDEVLVDILEVFEANKQKQTDGTTEITTKIIWPDVVAKDDKDLIEELAAAKDAGLISQFTGVKKYLKIKNDDDVQVEVDRINLDINIDNDEGDK